MLRRTAQFTATLVCSLAAWAAAVAPTNVGAETWVTRAVYGSATYDSSASTTPYTLISYPGPVSYGAVTASSYDVGLFGARRTYGSCCGAQNVFVGWRGWGWGRRGCSTCTSYAPACSSCEPCGVACAPCGASCSPCGSGACGYGGSCYSGTCGVAGTCDSGNCSSGNCASGNCGVAAPISNAPLQPQPQQAPLPATAPSTYAPPTPGSDAPLYNNNRPATSNEAPPTYDPTAPVPPPAATPDSGFTPTKKDRTTAPASTPDAEDGFSTPTAAPGTAPADSAPKSTPATKKKAAPTPTIPDEESSTGTAPRLGPALNLDDKVTWRSVPERQRLTLKLHYQNARLIRAPAAPLSDWTPVSTDAKLARK